MRALTIVVVLVAAALTACEPRSPANPSYETDVRPIFLAHCVRCHGAGGTLQGEPGAAKPVLCHLDIFDDVGDCTAGLAGCTMGARTCVDMNYFNMVLPTMPPAPATINAWERDVLTRWGKDPRP